MSEIYLTSNLVIRNQKTYFTNDETGKVIHVNSNNWHKYLTDYGWSKMDYGWVRRLNRYKTDKKRVVNSPWGVLECGGDGNCLFNSVAEAINEPDSQEIRKLASKEITDENFETIIETYRIMFDSNDFIHEWNPWGVDKPEELQEELVKEGNNFIGDHLVIQLIESALDINIIVLNSENEEKKKLDQRFTVHNIGNILNTSRKTVILYYIDFSHFKLVGYFNVSYMCKLFNEIPEELWMLYRNDCKIE